MELDFMFNDKSLKPLRKRLRNDPSPVEVLLWAHLRGRQMDGFKFRRQYSVGPYVLDFYCPLARFGVEVDGEEHFLDAAREAHDKQRDAFIQSQGIRLLHVTGKEVNENPDGVIERILEYLHGNTTP